MCFFLFVCAFVHVLDIISLLLVLSSLLTNVCNGRNKAGGERIALISVRSLEKVHEFMLRISSTCWSTHYLFYGEREVKVCAWQDRDGRKENISCSVLLPAIQIKWVTASTDVWHALHEL